MTPNQAGTHRYAARLALGTLLVCLGLCGANAYAQDEASPVDAADPTAAASPDLLSVLGDYQPEGKIARVRGVETGKTLPAVHVVRQGNTLWDISQRYFRDPYVWPALWANNPHITNPHWIFPGDIVYLRAPGDGEAIPSSADMGYFYSMAYQRGTSIMPAGFYTQEELDKAGRVVFSPEEKHMLTFHDEAYVDWEDIERRKRVQAGQSFAIYREDPPARNRDSGNAVARKLILVGTLDIIYNDGIQLPTGMINNAYQEIHRGDLLLPLRDVLLRMAPTTNTRDVEANIIDAVHFVTQLGEQQMVLINRGHLDGVALGNRWMVFEQREGVVPLKEGEVVHTQTWAERHAEAREKEREKSSDRDGKIDRPDDLEWPFGRPTNAPVYPKKEKKEDDFSADREYDLSDLPLRLIGELMVVKTTDRFCTAIVIDASREFPVGTRVVLIDGY